VHPHLKPKNSSFTFIRLIFIYNTTAEILYSGTNRAVRKGMPEGPSPKDSTSKSLPKNQEKAD
jgi:hypothetical protein